MDWADNEWLKNKALELTHKLFISDRPAEDGTIETTLGEAYEKGKSDVPKQT